MLRKAMDLIELNMRISPPTAPVAPTTATL